MLCCCHLQFFKDQRNEYARYWSLSKGWSLNHQEIIMCDKIIKLVSLNRPERFEQQNRVYSVEGISPTLKLMSKEKSGASIICKSKLYALAGNSIVTNCLTAMFEELIFPSGNHYHDKNGQLSLF